MATYQEKVEKFKTLSRKEAEVVFYFCKGMSDDEISSVLGGITVKAIGARKTEIYRKLNIEVPDSEKRDFLYAEYCPIVSELVPSEDALKRWRPLKSFDVGDEPEGYGEVIDPKPSQIRPSRGVRTFRLVFYSVVAILAIAAVGYFAFTAGRNSPAPAITEATNISANEQTNIPQSSPGVQENTNEPVINPTLPPSRSPIPSDTPSPTDTTTPSAVATEPFAFSDDFEIGLNPAWSVVYGNPVISNGQLQSSESTLLSVGDTSWTNYKVEFDVKMGRFTCQDDQSSTLGVRASDIDNMLLLRFHPCETEWSSVINGTRNVIPGTFLGNQGFTDVFVHFIVVVEGNKITFHEKSNLLNSFIDTDHPSGNIYLQIRPETVFDNFKITLLNP